MTIRTCRDCGRAGDEAPDDPAPGLCPMCYEARLERISAKFEVMYDTLQHPLLVAAWLEQALEEVGGETPDYARQHASTLLRTALRGEQR